LPWVTLVSNLYAKPPRSHNTSLVYLFPNFLYKSSMNRLQIHNCGSSHRRCGERYENSPYQWYVESPTPGINDTQSRRLSISTMQRIFWKISQAATPRINDTRSRRLLVSTICRVANFNTKSQMLQQLCKGPVPKRLIKNPSHWYIPLNVPRFLLAKIEIETKSKLKPN
jgi:hypothetical protein